jgi:hypothetical protein
MKTCEQPKGQPDMDDEACSKLEGIDWSLEQWASWVAERVNVRESTFENEPSEMIAAYNRELRSTQDYHGRELLELLQNADDAGIGFGSNKALIHLSAEGVCMANTGVPFSAAGIQSLMISDRSPKQFNRTRYIGNRGLGFRSILAWTDCPFVLSGHLRLGFSSSLVTARLKALCAKNVRLRNEVEEMRQNGHQNPIPILACPAILEENRTAESLWPSAVNYKTMRELAAAIRAKGYDTVITIPFTETGAYKEVSAQIAELSQELMLFLQNLEELVIRTESGSRIWRVKREREEVHVVTEGDATHPTSSWRVFTRQGEVPDNHLEKHQRATPGFEIKIAVPLQGEQAGMLFSYFPTKVRFPYLVVVHATMDLTSNRQNLVDTKANRYLVGQLAETLAEATEAALVFGDPWRPLRSIAKRGNLDPMLEQLGFEKALLAAARTKRLIPRRDGEVVQASSVKQLPVNPEGWLPKEGFADLALWTDDECLKRALEDLEVKQLDSDDLRERLNRLSPTLSITDRAALLAGILQRGKYLMPRNPPPRLLVDSDGTLIEPEKAAYLPPTTSRSFSLPEWMPLRFVSRELIEALQTILRISREALVEELKAFNLHTYDFGGLAGAIVARTNDRCREEGVDEAAVRLQGLRALRELYESSSSDEVPKRRQDLRVRLPTRTRKWTYADELYLGKGYPNGDLMEALLGAIHPEKFVADPATFGPEEDAAGWDRFLQWIGVSALPRGKTLRLLPDSAQDYVKHICCSLRYPARFKEFEVKEPEKLKPTSLENLTSIEHIEEILEKADPHAILAWVAIDSRIENWRVNGDTTARLEARFRDRTMRSLTDQALLSYVLWLLREQCWLPTTGGQKNAPSRCVRARIANEEVRRIFPHPVVQAEHPLLKSLKVDHYRLMTALGRVGVCMTLEDLTWERCHKVLLELPDVDPSGAAAHAFYRMLIEKEEDTTIDTLTLRKQFREQGQLWCRLGEKWSYRPIREGIYFIADPTIPKAVEDIFPILDLPRGRRTDKIQRLFLAQALRATDVSRRVNNYTPLPRSELLNDEISRLKPFIFALRLDSNPDATGSTRLKNLKIITCSSVQAVAHVKGHEIPLRLEARGDALICEDVAYLVMDQIDAEHPLGSQTVSDRVANILATILQVERISDFARLATARHQERSELLSLILQHDGSEVLQRARETLELSDEEEDIAGSTRMAAPTVPPNESQTSKLRQENDDTTGGSQNTDTSSQIPLPNRVTSKQVSHIPTNPARRVSLRVQSKRCSPDRIQRTHRVTDGNRCEELVQLFEEEQGRYPLLVSAIQGKGGFGCDLLSFAMEIDRERFKNGEADINCVQRFIEVKGRSSQGGGIQLEGNQLRAARDHGDKYFIYHVYEAVKGQEWQVVALQNPLAYEWPISYSVDPFQRAEAECWSVAAHHTDLKNEQSPTDDKTLDTVEEQPLTG